jgi:diguanylate cyclase (GGDEF)-like protein
MVARSGGEEFLIVCPQTEIEGAAAVAERIRQSVESTRIQSGDTEIRVTISAGVARRTENTHTPDDLLKAADEALYQAKGGGRNRVCRSDHPADAVNESTHNEDVSKTR